MMEKNDVQRISVKLAFRFLRRLCPDHLYEEIEGDLIQKYAKETSLYGQRRATRRLVWSVIRFCRPGIVLRNKASVNISQFYMLRHFIKMSFRHWRTDKVFSGINTIGLSISMAVCLLILSYVNFEFSYDNFHAHAKQIYRVTTTSYEHGNEVSTSALSSQVVGPAFKKEFHQVSTYTQLLPTRSWFDCTMRYDGPGQPVIFNEKNLYFTDRHFLSVFAFPLIRGEHQSVLKNPFSAVLSRTVAAKYFGNADPLGKILHLKGSFEENDYTVTGVMEDIPQNTHLDIDILLSVNSLEHNQYVNNWDVYTYVILETNAKVNAIMNRLSEFSTRYLAMPMADVNTLVKLQPIEDIHLSGHIQDELTAAGNVKTLYFLLAIAIVIVLMAWINYMNMAIARGVERAKEVGVRKMTGATRALIVKQFLTESVIVTMLSAVLAVFLCQAAAPFFYTFLGIAFSFRSAWDVNPSNVLVMVCLVVFCTGLILSGYYPARMIASFNPARALKGRFSRTGKGLLLQKGLIIFQFSASIIIMTGVMILHNQLAFMQNEPLGIDIAKTLVIKAPIHFDSTYRRRLSGFKDKLHTLAVVTNVTTSSAIPGERVDWQGSIRRELDKSLQHNFSVHVVDADFINAYKLTLLAGRNFVSTDFPGVRFGSKTENIILTREAVRQLLFTTPQEALGAILYWDKNKCRVVGVIEDFHQQSFKKALSPTLFTVNDGPAMSLKLGSAVNADNLKESISRIRDQWNTYFPDDAFDYFLLEDFYQRQYSNDVQFMRLFNIFCGVALLIAVLGLFGMSAFKVRQRTREIGIRKVLGASVGQITILVSKEFLILVFMANGIAWPVAYGIMNDWLGDFAYRIDIRVSNFIVPGVCALLLALVTVAAQSVKAASANPVKNLQSE